MLLIRFFVEIWQLQGNKKRPCSNAVFLKVHKRPDLTRLLSVIQRVNDILRVNYTSINQFKNWLTVFTIMK